MTYDRQRKHERLFADYFCNTSHRFAEVDLFRTKHSDCLSFQPAVNERSAHNVDQILDG